MKIQEINKKSNTELQKILMEKRENLRQLRFNLAAGKVKNIREIRSTKKDIAKTLTVLNSKSKTPNNK